VKPILHCAFAALIFASIVSPRAPAADSTLPRIAFGAGNRQLARTGVAAAATGELLDAPPLLAAPGGQQFVRETLAQLALLAPADKLRPSFVAVRREFDTRDVRFDRARALDAYGALLKKVLDALSNGQRRVFLVGQLTQSIAYNARVLRETEADRYRATLAGIADADGSSPGLADLRAQLGRLDAADWSASAGLAVRAVAAIVGSPNDVPFPSAPSIWTIVVRSREPAGRSATHLALDVVWFDGHHQTFSANPDGDDFSRNADRLQCVRDREPFSSTLHASPLVIPGDRGYDGLAASFERSCDAFNAQPPAYVVADAGDDRFVAAMLTAAGLEPKRAMGQSLPK